MEIFVQIVRGVYDYQVEITVWNLVQTIKQVTIDNDIVSKIIRQIIAGINLLL